MPWISLGLYLAAWAPFALCLAFYGVRSSWRSSAVGRGMFTLYAALTAVLTMVLLSLAGWVPEELRALVRVVFLGGVSAAGWIQLANILRIQRQDRRCPDQPIP